jgi:diaminohydroxyphosphoribosylaminopyrimidine deaminase / 5-amino-6-(5-phosphoribosylamino)uracil reductase
MTSDQEFMRRALALALRGQGRVHPNPMVGSVLVKNGRVIAEGWHTAYGEPHAEAHALAKAGDAARGATVYVNLEPCAHWGKTPPCADALIAAGVRHVVAAMKDPFPKVAGRGFAKLKRAGIRVTLGTLEEEARFLNRGFLRGIQERRPYVTLKVAASLDGRVATKTGESQWITSLDSRRAGHALRAGSDGIAVGVGTVLADNPDLSAHGRGRNPRVVVFDSLLRTPPRARVVRDGTLFLATAKAPKPRAAALVAKGAEVVTVAGTSRVALPAALAALNAHGIGNLLVEGGPELASAFLDEGCVDQVFWFVAPLLIGGSGARSAVVGNGAAHLRNAATLRNLDVARIGPDICLHGFLKDL